MTPLIPHFDLLATAPGGVARLRELILTLAVQGKLVPQEAGDEPASVLLQRIRAEKDRLIAAGEIKRDKPMAEISDEELPFEIPTGWTWARIPALTYSLGQGEPSTPFTYIDVAAIENIKGVITNNIQVIHPTDAPSRARKNVAVGTVLYSTIRPYLKNIAIVEQDYQPRPIASTAFATMHPHQGLISRYLLTYLRSKPFTDFANSKSVGIAYPAINDANFFQGLIALPPTAEQSRIVTRVEELMRLCDALEQQRQLETAQHVKLLNTLLGTLTDCTSPDELAAHWQRVSDHFDLLLDRPEAVDALEQTILQLAVRGLLVPQDPADEQASVLLQRIRAEKDRLIAAGEIKRDKPLTAITDEEKPFALQEPWAWVRVGDLVEMLNGYAFKSEWFKNIGTRLLRNVNISHGHIDWSQPAFVDSSTADAFSSFALKAGDIVLSLDRPIISTGLKYAIVKASDLPCLLLQRVARLSPYAAGMSADFFVLWLQSDLFMRTIDPGRSNGVPHISTKQVANLVIGLPPLAEQARIVARVTQLRSLCADLRQRLSARQSTQSRLGEALVEV
ncbi:type I restriction enzyme S subunit [Sphaerotilus hippei]|uniref:Type I restriction enzyme S subunit n=1 Tax=Sphaerotilus hippei TaxID=744406 RepID=A0A318H3Q1_9BURK|nr:restriction endonuclease subunit S [Sphaerotilus hippei]PXW98187.1 type I restriction enzyme S subunit [Sphaerotilus hippei]